jgi:hypothetical protein
MVLHAVRGKTLLPVSSFVNGDTHEIHEIRASCPFHGLYASHGRGTLRGDSASQGLKRLLQGKVVCWGTFSR